MNDELKPVTTEPVIVSEEESSPETMYCWIYDSNEKIIKCPAKSSGERCRAYAHGEGAAYYSYK